MRFSRRPVASTCWWRPLSVSFGTDASIASSPLALSLYCYRDKYTLSRDIPSMKALQGIRVLDLSRMVAGGIAGMLMADFGAEVVKIEQPGTGDPLRQWTADGRPLWWKV